MIEYMHVYCKVECPYCKDAISLLEEEKKDFVVTVIDHCKAFEDGIKKELNFKTVPIILRCLSSGNVEMIGGYTELRSFIQKEKEEK
tara:strand:+ start:315 stop:575 length:261 start_codon:yes stop_codon:yes gene_type:complete